MKESELITVVLVSLLFAILSEGERWFAVILIMVYIVLCVLYETFRYIFIKISSRDFRKYFWKESSEGIKESGNLIVPYLGSVMLIFIVLYSLCYITGNRI